MQIIPRHSRHLVAHVVNHEHLMAVVQRGAGAGHVVCFEGGRAAIIGSGGRSRQRKPGRAGIAV